MRLTLIYALNALLLTPPTAQSGGAGAADLALLIQVNDRSLFGEIFFE